MKIKELVKNLIPTFIAVVALVVLVNFSMTSTIPAKETGEGINYHGYVCVYKNDELIECGHNLFTNLGKNITRDRLGMSGLAQIDYVAVANNTVAQGAGDTSLQGEWSTCGMARAQGTFGITQSSHGNWTIQRTFTSSCNNVIVNATGLYNQSSGNFLFAEDTFTSTTLQTGDSLTVTWYIWVT